MAGRRRGRNSAYRLTPRRRAALRKAQAASARKRKRGLGKKTKIAVGVLAAGAGAAAVTTGAVYGSRVYNTKKAENIARDMAAFTAKAAVIRRQRGLVLYDHRGGRSKPVEGLVVRRSKTSSIHGVPQGFYRGYTATNKQPIGAWIDKNTSIPSRRVDGGFKSTIITGTKVRHPLAKAIMNEKRPDQKGRKRLSNLEGYR